MVIVENLNPVIECTLSKRISHSFGHNEYIVLEKFKLVIQYFTPEQVKERENFFKVYFGDDTSCGYLYSLSQIIYKKHGISIDDNVSFDAKFNGFDNRTGIYQGISIAYPETKAETNLQVVDDSAKLYQMHIELGYKTR